MFGEDGATEEGVHDLMDEDSKNSNELAPSSTSDVPTASKAEREVIKEASAVVAQVADLRIPFPVAVMVSSIAWGLGRVKAEVWLAGSISLLTIAVFLWLSPGYLGLPIISTIVSIFSATLAVFALGLALASFAVGRANLKYSRLAAGLLLGILWAGVYFLFSTAWIDALNLVLLFAASYFSVRGIIDVFKYVLTTFSGSQGGIKLVIVIVQLAAFILTILQIMSILKVIK